MCNIYAKKDHEPSCSNQAQQYVLGLSDVTMEYTEKFGMRGEPIPTVCYLGPQSIHHSANKSDLDDSQWKWICQQKGSEHCAVHGQLKMRSGSVGVCLRVNL